MADQYTELPIKGKKGNNATTPSTTNLGVLPAIANAAAQSWTEGNQVLLSSDLAGNLRVVVTAALPTGANTIGNVGLVAGAATIGAVNQAGTWTVGLSAGSNLVGAVKITDAGGTNQLSVNATGQVTISNTSFAATQSGTWTVATNADGTIGAGTAPSKALVAGAIFNTAAPTLTNGQGAALQSDSSGNLKVVVQGAVNVNLNAGTNIVGKVGIDQTTPGTTNAVALAQIGGNTVSAGSGASGTGTLRTVLSSDFLSTTQISATSAANAVGNPIFTKLTDGTAAIGTQANPLYTVSQGASSTIVDAPNLTSAAVAAGGTATLASAFISAGKTGKLAEITASSSVRTKVVVQTYNGTAAVTKRVFFVSENQTLVYKPADDNEITFAGNGTNTVFQLVITNMDNLNAADVYGSISYYEV